MSSPKNNGGVEKDAPFLPVPHHEEADEEQQPLHVLGRWESDGISLGGEDSEDHDNDPEVGEDDQLTHSSDVVDGKEFRALKARLHRMEQAHEELKALIERKGRGTEQKIEELKTFVEQQVMVPESQGSRRGMLTRVATTLCLVDTESSLDADTFSLMMIAKVRSQSWILGLVSLCICRRMCIMYILFSLNDFILHNLSPF